MRVGFISVRQPATLFNHCLFPQIHGSSAAIAHNSISSSRVSHRFHFKNNCGLIPFLKLIELLSRSLSNVEIALLRLSSATMSIPRRRLGLRETQVRLWSAQMRSICYEIYHLRSILIVNFILFTKIKSK